ncbi:hypothetical protein QUS22_05480, partial [Wolbachia pipientis]|nr:hypothetical protein [Wolbachia pipientis]
WSEKEFIAYEQEIKRIRDEKAVHAQKLEDARKEGIQIGEEKGKKVGGLGIPSFRWNIPLYRKRRMENMMSSDSTIIKAVVATPSFLDKKVD